MKGVLEIRKLLLAANLILLAILVYVAAGFIFGNDAEHSTIIDPTPKIGEGEITLRKDPILLDNHKIILRRNIFGSAGASAVKENPQQEQKDAPAPFVRELRLLATVAGDEEVACAVIENVKTKIQDLYKIGDIIEGAQVETIERNRIVLFNGVQREELNLYVAGGVSDPVEKTAEPVMVMARKPGFAEVVNIISPTEREINKKAFLAKVGGMEAILRTVEVTPYVVNGKEEGLRINGLEDLSMARYVGFENGDVIQVINGQTVTNQRKAFQILRKARAQSSLDIQLLRNQEKKELSFGIK